MVIEDPNKKVQKGGSQFTDVSNYLAQNADQGKRLASNVGQSVVDAGNKAKQSSQNIQKNFGQAVNSSTIPYQEQIAQRAMQDPRSFYAYQAPKKPTKKGKNDFSGVVNYLSQKTGGPTPISPAFIPSGQYAPDTVGNEQDVAAFEKMRDAQYLGPMDLTEIDGYQNALDLERGALGASGQVMTDVGRQDLLNQISRGPGIGASALDQLLLSRGDANTLLNDSADQNLYLKGALEQANDSSRDQSQAALDTTNQTRQRIQDDIYGDNGVYKLFKDQLNKSRKMKSKSKLGKQKKSYLTNLNKQNLNALNRLMGKA